MFTYNTNKALELMKSKIRKKRTKLFNDLDVQFIRAIESENVELRTQIVAQKEILRNLTDISIDNISSRDELIALWPEDIMGENPFPKNS